MKSVKRWGPYGHVCGVKSIVNDDDQCFTFYRKYHCTASLFIGNKHVVAETHRRAYSGGAYTSQAFLAHLAPREWYLRWSMHLRRCYEIFLADGGRWRDILEAVSYHPFWRYCSEARTDLWVHSPIDLFPWGCGGNPAPSESHLRVNEGRKEYSTLPQSVDKA